MELMPNHYSDSTTKPMLNSTLIRSVGQSEPRTTSRFCDCSPLGTTRRGRLYGFASSLFHSLSLNWANTFPVCFYRRWKKSRTRVWDWVGSFFKSFLPMWRVPASSDAAPTRYKTRFRIHPPGCFDSRRGSCAWQVASSSSNVIVTLYICHCCYDSHRLHAFGYIRTVHFVEKQINWRKL